MVIHPYSFVYRSTYFCCFVKYCHILWPHLLLTYIVDVPVGKTCTLCTCVSNCLKSRIKQTMETNYLVNNSKCTCCSGSSKQKEDIPVSHDYWMIVGWHNHLVTFGLLFSELFSQVKFPDWDHCGPCQRETGRWYQDHAWCTHCDWRSW